MGGRSARKAYRLQAVGRTHVGLVRAKNEDRFLLFPERGVFLLADGMGGHQGGDVAAQASIDLMRGLLEEQLPVRKEGELSVEQAIACWKGGIRAANEEVFKLASSERRLRGMGSTLVGLYVRWRDCVYAHVGDSRLYLWRKGVLEQLTQDHSLLNQMLFTGRLRSDQVEHFLYRHVITRAVGTRRRMEIDVGERKLQIGDQLLLCSDGLSDGVPNEKIEEMLSLEGELAEGADRLIDAALQAGGEDNVTVLLIRVAKG